MRINDIELGGRLSQASQSGGGATFALLLAMLHQNLLERPHLADSPVSDKAAPELLSAGPAFPLKTESEHWQSEAIHAGYINKQLTASARLWHCMHPAPLSIHNDAKRLDDEVLANCDFYTRQRLAGKLETEMSVDETGLFELLEGLQEVKAA